MGKLYRAWEAQCQRVRDDMAHRDKLIAEHRLKETVELRINSPFRFLTSTAHNNVPWLLAEGILQMDTNYHVQIRNGVDLELDNLLLINSSKSPRLSLMNAIMAKNLEDYCAGYDAVMKNNDWSETKKDAEINKLRVTWDATLATVEQELVALQMDINAIQNEMEAAALELAQEAFKAAFLAPADAAKEIRAHLATMTLASDRRSFLTENVEPQIFFALKTYPLVALRQAMVDDEMVGYYTDLVTAKTFPEKVYAQTIAKEVFKECRMNLDSLKRARTPRELSSSRRIKIPEGPNLTQRSIAANAAK